MGARLPATPVPTSAILHQPLSHSSSSPQPPSTTRPGRMAGLLRPTRLCVCSRARGSWKAYECNTCVQECHAVPCQTAALQWLWRVLNRGVNLGVKSIMYFHCPPWKTLAVCCRRLVVAAFLCPCNSQVCAVQILHLITVTSTSSKNLRPQIRALRNSVTATFEETP